MLAHFTGEMIRPNNAKKNQSGGYIKQQPYQSRRYKRHILWVWGPNQRLTRCWFHHSLFQIIVSLHLCFPLATASSLGEYTTTLPSEPQHNLDTCKLQRHVWTQARCKVKGCRRHHPKMMKQWESWVICWGAIPHTREAVLVCISNAIINWCLSLEKQKQKLFPALLRNKAFK